MTQKKYVSKHTNSAIKERRTKITLDISTHPVANSKNKTLYSSLKLTLFSISTSHISDNLTQCTFSK